MPEDRKLDSEAAVKLIMEIVDLEDQNRIKAIHGINQKIKGMIKNATTMDNSGEGN
ncbi:MAG: hypothetical protein OXI24_00030 [Candidatus Poribacteria bacterium]|nr:hypothetical protein [Candidatus Poribacteria bacterium]